MDKLNYYANRHNEIAARYGISYEFHMPPDVNSELARGIDGITMLVFFQGYPIGAGERYFIDRFEISGARVLKNKSYYVTRLDGVWRYHRGTCTKPADDLGVYQFQTKKECAEAGALPCPYCNP